MWSMKSQEEQLWPHFWGLWGDRCHHRPGKQVWHVRRVSREGSGRIWDHKTLSKASHIPPQTWSRLAYMLPDCLLWETGTVNMAEAFSANCMLMGGMIYRGMTAFHIDFKGCLSRALWAVKRTLTKSWSLQKVLLRQTPAESWGQVLCREMPIGQQCLVELGPRSHSHQRTTSDWLAASIELQPRELQLGCAEGWHIVESWEPNSCPSKSRRWKMESKVILKHQHLTVFAF